MKVLLVVAALLIVPNSPVLGASLSRTADRSQSMVPTLRSEMQTSLDLLYRPLDWMWTDSCRNLLKEVGRSLSLWPKSCAIKRACGYVLAQAMATTPNCHSTIGQGIKELGQAGLDPSFAIYEVEAHIHAGRFDAASSLAKRLLTRMPGSTRLLYDLGLANMAQGRFVEASSCLAEAAASGYPAAQWGLGVCAQVNALISKPSMEIEDGIALLEGLNVSSCWKLWDQYSAHLRRRFPNSLLLNQARTLHLAWRICKAQEEKPERDFEELLRAVGGLCDGEVEGGSSAFNASMRILESVKLELLKQQMLFALSEALRYDRECGPPRGSPEDSHGCTLLGTVPGLKGFYPDHVCLERGVSVLLLNDAQDPSWKGPYLPLFPKDGWGSPFLLAKTSAGHEVLYWCISAGPDFALQTDPCTSKAGPFDPDRPYDVIVQYQPGREPIFIGFDGE